MGLREFLDDLLPVDTPDEVRKRMYDYGRKRDMSEAELLEMFGPSLRRAVRKEKEKNQKRDMNTAAAKRKITQAEGKAKKKAKNMNKGGYANCGASMKPTQKSSGAVKVK